MQVCLVTHTLCDLLKVSAFVSLYSFTVLMPLTTGETTESTAMAPNCEIIQTSLLFASFSQIFVSAVKTDSLPF